MASRLFSFLGSMSDTESPKKRYPWEYPYKRPPGVVDVSGQEETDTKRRPATDNPGIPCD